MAIVLEAGSSSSVSGGITTRLAIIQRMSDALGLRLYGTLPAAVAASSTSVADARKRTEQDDYPNEGFFLATSSGGVVEEHRISDFANASATLSLYGSGLTTSLASGLSYDVLLPPVTPDHYRSAIRAAASKIAGRGIARRMVDTTIVTTGSRRYAIPSAIDLSVSEVLVQPQELITNNLWIDGETGWTLHANAALANDGPHGERTLSLTATAADQATTFDVDCAGGEEWRFFATHRGDDTAGSRWRYLILDEDGTTVVALTGIGTAVDSTPWTSSDTVVEVPVNGRTVRFYYDADQAGAVDTMAPQLMRHGDWTRIAGWKIEYEGNTGYIILPGIPLQGRRLKVVGKSALETLSSDTDTISLDEPEIAAFTELCCAEAWRQFGGRLGMASTDVDREIAKHESVYRDIISRMTGPWRQVRRARYPSWWSNH